MLLISQAIVVEAVEVVAIGEDVAEVTTLAITMEMKMAIRMMVRETMT
jgi:hypothetical protein